MGEPRLEALGDIDCFSCLQCMLFSFALVSVVADSAKGVTLLFSEIFVVGVRGN